MLRNKFFASGAAAASLAALFLLPACSGQLQKEGNEQNKQVGIKTLLGELHGSKQADACDIGLAVYPVARLTEKHSDHSDKSANVSISGLACDLKVVARKYESDDSPPRVLSSYQDQLKKYSNVLECPSPLHRSHDSHHGSNELTCAGDNGKDVELKAGRKDEQRIVAVEPEGRGSSFALVSLRTHGRDGEI